MDRTLIGSIIVDLLSYNCRCCTRPLLLMLHLIGVCLTLWCWVYCVRVKVPLYLIWLGHNGLELTHCPPRASHHSLTPPRGPPTPPHLHHMDHTRPPLHHTCFLPPHMLPLTTRALLGHTSLPCHMGAMCHTLIACHTPVCHMARLVTHPPLTCVRRTISYHTCRLVQSPLPHRHAPGPLLGHIGTHMPLATSPYICPLANSLNTKVFNHPLISNKN